MIIRDGDLVGKTASPPPQPLDAASAADVAVQKYVRKKLHTGYRIILWIVLLICIPNLIYGAYAIIDYQRTQRENQRNAQQEHVRLQQQEAEMKIFREANDKASKIESDERKKAAAKAADQWRNQ